MLPNYDNSTACIAVKMRNPRAVLGANRRIPAQEALTAAPVDLNVEIADLLPQRVAVEAQQVGGADLVAAGRRQRRREQRDLDLLEDAVIEPGRRHAVGEDRKMRRQIGLDRAAEIVDAVVYRPA